MPGLLSRPYLGSRMAPGGTTLVEWADKPDSSWRSSGLVALK